MTAKELLELRAKRKTTKGEIDAIVQKATDEKREKLTDAEETEIRTKEAELADMDKRIDGGLDAVETEKRQAEERERIATEARREERLAQIDRENSLRSKRQVLDRERETAEIRVHDAFPMIGKQARAFTALWGDEKRGRAEAYKAGMWLIGEVFGNAECRQWNRDYGYGQEARVLNNVVPTAGAILVPDGLVNAIIWNAENRGIFAQFANVVPMGQNDVVTIPKSTGEVTVYAVAENMTDEVTQSEPTFDGVELIARTWGALTLIGRNLVDDAVINIAEHVSQKIGWAMADKQDRTGFLGDGTSTYHNIVGLVPKISDGNHTASVVTAITGNTGFGTLDMEDFEAVIGALPQWAEGDDVAWYMSKAGYYASMARLMDAAGGNTQTDVAGGKQLQLMGYPVRISQILYKTLGAQVSQIVALFGSLKKTSAFGMKKTMQVQVLIEKYATLNQIGLLAFSRWGINNHELGDNTNAGAMIALKTAAS